MFVLRGENFWKTKRKGVAPYPACSVLSPWRGRHHSSPICGSQQLAVYARYDGLYVAVPSNLSRNLRFLGIQPSDLDRGDFDHGNGPTQAVFQRVGDMLTETVVQPQAPGLYYLARLPAEYVEGY